MKETCGMCRFWQKLDDTAGRCRGAPPVFVPGRAIAVAPITLSYDWCGQWQPKREERVNLAEKEKP